MESVKVAQLVNFSHGLTAEAHARLEEIAGGPVIETVIPCQFDMAAPLKSQMDALLAANERAVYRMDLYIPPALSFAAAYITARLSYAQSDAMLPVPPAMVIMRREGTPPRYIPAEIIYA